MAEIGLIASVIQVAGAGLKLSQTLYQYADSVASADRRIKDIAKEIKLTSLVIDELGDIFKADNTSTLLSKNALKTADETVRECSTVFSELDAALKKSAKAKMGKWLLPFKESKIELLRAHVDKLKSTLQLLMQVLTHAHQVASQKLDRTAEAAQRKEIKALLQTKKESTKRYEESLRRWSTSDDSTVIDDEDARDLTSGQLSIASAIQSTITVESLGTCMRHVLSLLQDIGTLQETLSSDGEDPSEHQQTLVGSYFRARGHLDALLLGNPRPPPRLSANSIEVKTPDKTENELKIVKAQQEAQKKAEDEKRTKSIQSAEKNVQYQVAQITVEDEKRRAEFERIVEEQKRSIQATIEATLTRGERLESVRDESETLAKQAQRFYKEAKMREKEERDIVLLQHQNTNDFWEPRGGERHFVSNGPGVGRRNSISQRRPSISSAPPSYLEKMDSKLPPLVMIERAPEVRQKMELKAAERKYEVAESRMRHEKDIERQKYEAEYARKKYEEEAVRKKFEEEAVRKKYEEEAVRKKYEEEAVRKKYEEEAVRKKYDEEAAKEAANEAAAKEAAKQAKAAAEAKATSTNQQPILFKDAIGRKFSFPFHLCATWQGMHNLISQAFLHIDSMSTDVHEGRFNLLNSDSEIIIPTCWDSTIQPGWHITMQMWSLMNSAHFPIPLHSSQPVKAPLPPGPEIIHPKPKDTILVPYSSIPSTLFKAKASKATHKSHKPGHTKTTRGPKSSSSNKDKARTKSTKRNTSSVKRGRENRQYMDIETEVEAEVETGAEDESILNYDNSFALQRPEATQQLMPIGSTEMMFYEAAVSTSAYQRSLDQTQVQLRDSDKMKKEASGSVTSTKHGSDSMISLTGSLDGTVGYSPASISYLPTLPTQEKPQRGEWEDVDFQGHPSESLESLKSGSHKADQGQEEEEEEEEEVNELLREWTTVFD